MDLLAAPVFHCAAGKNRSIIFDRKTAGVFALNMRRSATFSVIREFHAGLHSCYGMV
jgi:hypothetical protein